MMTPDKTQLDLLIARAKFTSDQLWTQLQHTFAAFEVITNDNRFDLRDMTYNVHVGMCKTFSEHFPDMEIGELLATEMILRAGKRMKSQLKIAYRKKADQLSDNILRRKIDDPSSPTR